MFEDLKKTVLEANQLLVKSNLVILNWGNASQIDEGRKYIAIKPSGVDYEKLKTDDIVITDLEGNVVEGNLKPSSDLRTHLEIYRNFKKVGGVVHTHSCFATSWAQAGANIPVFGTTHADNFYGSIPCTRPLTNDEISGDYELNTGKVIVETFKGLDPVSIPGVVVYAHGPFTWGENAIKAVENSLVLEESSKMAYLTLAINGTAKPINKELLDKHFLRKHGDKAYYGQ